MKELVEITQKLDKILDFLDIQQHRLTTENSRYSPDTLQKLVSDTVLSVMRDSFFNRNDFDASSDYIKNCIARDGAKLFRSDYIPRKYGFMDYDSRYDLFRYALSLAAEEPGIYLEFGVYQGGSAEFMARYTDEPIYGFDSFEGLPEDWIPGSQVGRFSLEGKPPKVSAPNIEFIKGWFDATVPSFIAQNRERKIKFIHFDCDLYLSHKIVFDELLSSETDLQGTIALFDEYVNFPNWQEDGHKALQEFTRQGPWGYRYVGFTTRYTAVAIEFFRK